MKKTTVNLDDFEFDDDLNFDFDVGEANFNPEATNQNRTPVGSIIRGVADSTLEEYNDPEKVRRLVARALPEGYQQLNNDYERVKDNVSSTYRDAVSQVKPIAKSVFRNVNKIVPDNFTKIKGILAKIEEKAGFNEYSYNNRQDTIDDKAKRELDVYNIEANKRAETLAIIKEQIDQKRHKTEVESLRDIHFSLEKISSFNDSVNMTWQRKSLEVQYKSFFVQAQLLEETTKANKAREKQLEGIAKNTSLPDFAKITMYEKFKDVGRNKFFGSLQNGLFGKGDVIEQGLGRLRKKALGTVSDFTSALDLANLPLTAIADQTERQRETDQFEKENYGKDPDLKRRAGGMLGTLLNKLVQDNVTSKIRKRIENNPDSKIGAFGRRIQSGYTDVSAVAEKARKSDYLKIKEDQWNSETNSWDDDPWWKKIAKTVGQEVTDSFIIKPDTSLSLTGYKAKTGESTFFNDKTDTAITTVIPELLSKIYQEVNGIRTGTVTDQVSFNYQSGKFETHKQTNAFVKAKLEKSIDRENTVGRAKYSAQELLGYEDYEKLSDTEKKQLQDSLLKAVNENTFGTKRIRNASDMLDFIDDAGLKSKITSYHEGDTSNSKRLAFLKEFKQLSESIPDIRRQVEDFNLKGYGGNLKELGIVKDNFGTPNLDTESLINYLINGKFDNEKEITDLSEEVRPFGSGGSTTNNISIAGLDKLTETTVSILAKLNDCCDCDKKKEEFVGVSTGIPEEVPEIVPETETSTFKVLAKSLDIQANILKEVARLQTGVDDASLMERIDLGSTATDIKKQLRAYRRLARTKGSQVRTQASDAVHNLKGLGTAVYDLSAAELLDMSTAIQNDPTKLATVKRILAQAKDAKHNLGGLASAVGEVGSDEFTKFTTGMRYVMGGKQGDIPEGLTEEYIAQLEAYLGKKDALVGDVKSAYESLTGKQDENLVGPVMPKSVQARRAAEQYLGTSKAFVSDLKNKVTGKVLLTKIQLESGEYVDVNTNKVIKTFEDITGEVKDKDGNMVITEKDIRDGITDVKGKIVDFATSIAERAQGQLPAGWNEVLQGSKMIHKSIGDFATKQHDIYVKGQKDPVLTASKLNAGEYICGVTNKVLKGFENIKGKVLDKQGNVVLSEEQIKEGLVDSRGKPPKGGWVYRLLKGIARVYFNELKRGLPKLPGLVLKNTMRTLKFANKVTGIGSAVYGGILGVPRKILNKETGEEEDKKPGLIMRGLKGIGGMYGRELRDGLPKIPGNIVRNTERTVNAAATVGGLYGKAVSAVVGVPKKEKPAIDNKGRLNPEEAKLNPTLRVLTEIKDALKPKKKGFNDADGDGRRTGDWRDLLGKPKAKKEKETKKEKEQPPEKDSWMGKLLGLVVAGFGAIKSLAGSILGGGLGLLGGAARGIGGAVLGGARALGGTALGGMAARGASTALGAVRGSLAAASLIPGVIGGMSGLAGAGLTALGGLLASPVVIGGAALAAVGYGGYKAYKYFTRNDLTPLSKIRLLQYGFSEQFKDHYYKVIQLENELIENGVGYQKGQAYLIEKELVPENLFEIFSIPTDDKTAQANFMSWFNSRFKPIFLTHLTGLYSIDDKMELEDVEKLKPEQKLKYLTLTAFENGPYHQATSPVSEINELSTGYAPVKQLVDEERKKHEPKSDNTATAALAAAAVTKTTDSKNDDAKKAAAVAATTVSAAAIMSKEQAEKNDGFFSGVWDGAKKGLAATGSFIGGVASATWEGTKDVAKGVYDAAVPDSAKKVIESSYRATKDTIAEMTGSKQNNVSGLIHWGESKQRGYNDYNRGSDNRAASSKMDIDLQNMTIAEIMQKQSLPVGHKERLFAVGKYQMIPDTMAGAVKSLNISPSEKFTASLQERMFTEYLATAKKGRGNLEKYIKGTRDDLKKANLDVAMEWASVAFEGNSGYWDGKGNNKAHISADEMRAALKTAREKYKSLVDSGMSEEQAYGIALGSYKSTDTIPKSNAGKPETAVALSPTEILTGEQKSSESIQASSPVTDSKPVSIKDTLLGSPTPIGVSGNSGPMGALGAAGKPQETANDPGEADSPPGQASGFQKVSQAYGDKAVSPGKLAVAGGEINSGQNADPHMKMAKGASLDGVHAGFLKQLKGAVQEYNEQTGKSVTFNDGFRTFADQAAIYKKHPGKAAKPGSSMHEKGLAVDIASVDANAMEKLGLMKKYGLTRPVGGEQWHVEPSVIQLDLPKAKNDPNWAGNAIEASYGRGGGGYGSIPGSPLRKRNPELAAKIVNQSGTPVNLPKTDTPLPSPTVSQPTSTGFVRVPQAEPTEDPSGNLAGTKQYGGSKTPESLKANYTTSSASLLDQPVSPGGSGSPVVTRQDENRAMSKVEDTLMKSYDIQRKILEAIVSLKEPIQQKQPPASAKMSPKQEATKPAMTQALNTMVSNSKLKDNQKPLMRNFMSMAA